MSTNYYGLSISEVKEWEQLRDNSIIDACGIEDLLPIINEYYEKRKPSKIHIGQSAAGWSFLFQYNGGKYYQSKLDFLNWIETLEITDEYGRSLTAGEFWCDVVVNRKGTKTRRSEDKESEYIVIDGMEFLDCEFS